MKLQTLVVTVDQTDHSLVERMNLQTDAVVGNQGAKDSVEDFSYRGNRITFYNSTQRGVGRNRNLVLEHSDADVCILADDDLRFVDGYPERMKKAMEIAPDADIWVFNLIEKTPQRYRIEKPMLLNKGNYGKFGAARLALRRSAVMDAGIRFSLLFGGGAKYGAGEDTLFLKECLDKRLKLVAVPIELAEIDQSAESTWFTGYHKKFFFDKGAAYRALYGKADILHDLRYLLKYRKKYKGQISLFSALSSMLNGRKQFLREADVK